MVSDLLVVMGASTTSGTMSEYIAQLSAAEIDFWIEDISGYPWLHRGAFISERLSVMRDFSNRFHNYRNLILSDAFDVTFYGTKDEAMKRIPDNLPLWAAEKNCYPEPNLREWIGGTTPWRFANGGLMAGTPYSIAKWCDDAERHHLYHPNLLDQQFLNRVLAEQTKEHLRAPFVQIDAKTELFFCLHSGYEELEWENGKPVNTFCNTRPCFIHANGKWPAEEAFRKRDESCRISQPSVQQ